MPRSSRACRLVSTLESGSLGTIFLCLPPFPETHEIVPARLAPLLTGSNAPEPALVPRRIEVLFRPIPQYHVPALRAVCVDEITQPPGVIREPVATLAAAEALNPNHAPQLLSHTARSGRSCFVGTALRARSISLHLDQSVGGRPECSFMSGAALCSWPSPHKPARTWRRFAARVPAKNPAAGS